jgi:hypothetical protein
MRCEAKVKNPTNTWIKYGSLAACAAAVLLFCNWAIPGLINNPTPRNPFTFDPHNTARIGMPVENFNLAELHDQSGVAASRLLIARTAHLFSNGAPDLVVFVRVIGTEQWTYKDSHTIYTSERQTSTAHILSTIWSGVDVPETISVMQHKYGGCCEGEETNLLRNGGVYMLPLHYWEGDDVWIINGDLDVLFEVDDEGRVWSHSEQKGFNCFDGKYAQELTDDIISITSDENFSAGITLFGRIAHGWGRLTEVTILSATHTVSEYGDDQIEYRMRADNIISVASNPAYTWQPEMGGEFTAISHGAVEYLEQGKRYLIHLDPSDGGPYIEEARTAVINADDTITAIPLSEQNNWQKNIFLEFNGYTVAQMQAEAERAKAWHSRYAK